MLLNHDIGEDSWESLGLQLLANQSILKEISPEYSLEGLILKLKLQYFGNLVQRTDSLERTLMLRKTEGRRRRGRQRTRWLDGITDSMDMSEQTPGDSEGQGSLACCSSWCLRVGNDLVTERNNYCSINVVTMAIFVLAFLTNGVILSASYKIQ